MSLSCALHKNILWSSFRLVLWTACPDVEGTQQVLECSFVFNFIQGDLVCVLCKFKTDKWEGSGNSLQNSKANVVEPLICNLNSAT